MSEKVHAFLPLLAVKVDELGATGSAAASGHRIKTVYVNHIVGAWRGPLGCRVRAGYGGGKSVVLSSQLWELCKEGWTEALLLNWGCH